MNLKVEQNEFNGKITHTIVPTKKVKIEDQYGLVPGDIIIGTIKFDPKIGSKKTYNEKYKREMINKWFFCTADIERCGDFDYSEYKNEYGNVKMNLGRCSYVNPDEFKASTKFAITLEPYLNKEGKEATMLRLEKVIDLTEKGKAIADYVKREKKKYYETIKVKENGEEKEVKISKLIPHYVLVQ